MKFWIIFILYHVAFASLTTTLYNLLDWVSFLKVIIPLTVLIGINEGNLYRLLPTRQHKNTKKAENTGGQGDGSVVP